MFESSHDYGDSANYLPDDVTLKDLGSHYESKHLLFIVDAYLLLQHIRFHVGKVNLSLLIRPLSIVSRYNKTTTVESFQVEYLPQEIQPWCRDLLACWQRFIENQKENWQWELDDEAAANWALSRRGA